MKPTRWLSGAALTLTLSTLSIVACNGDPDDSDGVGGDGSGGKGSGGKGSGGKGSGGKGSGGSGGDDGTGGMGGEGSCVPKTYTVKELCEAPNFSGGLVSAEIPEDPLENPEYSCSEDEPSGWTPNYRYREGCGMAEWFLSGALPPTHTLVWKLETTELIGCSYHEDYKIPEQCGDFSRHAGQRFSCDVFEEYYCVPTGIGGAGGQGPD